MSDAAEKIKNAIFKKIASEIQGALLEVSQKKLFQEFQVAVRSHPMELGNTVLHLEESPAYKRTVGKLKQSSKAADRVAGYALELQRRKDGKKFKLSDRQKQEVKAALKRRLRAT